MSSPRQPLTRRHTPPFQKKNDRMSMPPPPPRYPPSLRDSSPFRPPKHRQAATSSSSTGSDVSFSSWSSSPFPTSAISFRESNHGLLRRQQRGIAVRDLQAAVKYGKHRPGRPYGPNQEPTTVYEHAGVTYVVNDITGVEITSYGTFQRLHCKELSRPDWEKHKEACRILQSQPAAWKSHSVLLVDTSGSMRNSDVWGTRSRLGAVWRAIAEDFVARRIRTNSAGQTDAVTIVLMGQEATILIGEAPTDWVLYNRIVKIYNEGRVRACGHGCYRPSLDLAERLLLKNDSSSCALLLMMLSDGRPSDAAVDKKDHSATNTLIQNQVESLSSKLGRRLTVSTIGMGSLPDFDTLRSMADGASDYGSQGNFMLPSMTCSGLGQALSSVATSLTQSQTELLPVVIDREPATSWGDSSGGGTTERNDALANATYRQRKVRKVMRENKRKIPAMTEVVDDDEFHIYMNDKVVHMEFDPNVDSKFKKSSLQHPDACGVAMKKMAFGEGQERLAYQFFEIADDRATVLGAPLVAKGSRFAEEKITNAIFPFGSEAWEVKDKFVRHFCAVQHLARSAAKAFNEKLDDIAALDPDTARVSFLDCSVYYLTDEKEEESAVIVERKLEGKFRKWNSNNGWCNEQETPNGHPLETITEEDDETTTSGSNDAPIDVDKSGIFVTHNEVAQAFSHFSYVHSGKKMLICDLQGVYDKTNKLLRFTDPVVHYHDVQKRDKRCVYGRTDRGRKGMWDFFATHKCNSLCDLVTKGFITPTEEGRQTQCQDRRIPSACIP